MLRHYIDLTGFLLLVAALVAILARRWRIPSSVGLVAAGILLAVLPLPLDLPLSRDLVFSLFLPPIVFEAALNIHWHDFRRDVPVVAVFASAGVLIAAAIVATTMHFAAAWPWAMAGLFGAAIAATDPVSVIATFKRVRVDPRLHLLVETESLLSDGTAAVAFAVALAIVTGTLIDPVVIGVNVVRMVAGGILCGIGVAFGFLMLVGRTKDTLVELTLTTLIAYGSFLLADHYGMSGVLAALTAGLMVGNSESLGAISDHSRQAVIDYWAYVAFLASSLIFLLLGAQVAEQPFSEVIRSTIIAIVAVLIGRGVAIYGLSVIFARSRLRISVRHQHVLVWGGLRGALALGLVFALPHDLAGRGQIVTVAFAVVAFSIVAQGLTMAPLLRRLGLIRSA